MPTASERNARPELAAYAIPADAVDRQGIYARASNRKVDNVVMEKKIMLGNEAFARGAYEAGVKVVSSYPGTPSTEVTENAAKYAPNA